MERCLYPSSYRTINTKLHVFQCKVLNNYIFKLSDAKLCSFCNQEDKTIIHLFANCPKVNMK